MLPLRQAQIKPIWNQVHCYAAKGNKKNRKREKIDHKVTLTKKHLSDKKKIIENNC